MRERPLSPHLSVYRFKYTLTTSILNRFTGILLSIGLLLLVYWLMAVAQGKHAYALAQQQLSPGVVKLIYAGLLLAFSYHLIAGIRHLVWDTGRGLERAHSQRSAWVVVIVSLVLFGALGYWLAVGAHLR